jgi:ATP-dependent DNA helicase RecQ
MLWGAGDVAAQRRFIDTSDAEAAFKRVAHAKLDALLALVETAGCRRQALLAYFGEASPSCGNCDNCLSPPGCGTPPSRRARPCRPSIAPASASAPAT